MERSSSSRAVAKESASCADEVTDLFWTGDDCDGFVIDPITALEEVISLIGVEYFSVEISSLFPVGVETSIVNQTGNAVDEFWVLGSYKSTEVVPRGFKILANQSTIFEEQ